MVSQDLFLLLTLLVQYVLKQNPLIIPAPLADYTMLQPGQQMHMDWCFIGKTSIRGYNAILCVKYANTRKAWCFPCPTKRSHIDIIRYFILFLEKSGFIILQIRVDEDGSLAQCAEFCKLLRVLNITL